MIMFSFCDKSVEIPNMVFHQLTDLGWVAFGLCCLSDSAYADEILAEMAEQPGKMMEHPKYKSTQPKSPS